jgi:hypothetical protein
MKTVAIMTMGFLPGTFFAALLAVPSLQWNAPSVVQGRFWVYWAFTLPGTALVFLIWIVATEQGRLKHRLSSKLRLVIEAVQRLGASKEAN